MKRFPVIAAALLAVIAVGTQTRPAQAFFWDGPSGKGPWCGQLGDGADSFDCSFYSFEQCQAFVKGVGSICLPNTAYRALPAPRRIKRRG